MSSIPAVETASRMGNAESTLPAYCPYPLRASTPERVGLWRRVVRTSAGPVVVHAGRVAKGPATILLHGAAGSWSTWTPMLEASDASDAPLHDVIAIDLPGWGGSALSAPLDVPGMASVVAEVARSLGYERWNVVGHSLGGFVALELAAEKPAATLSVGLISATGESVVRAARHPVRDGRGVAGFVGMLVAMRVLAALGAAGTGLVRLLQRAGWLRVLASPLFAHPVDATVIAALASEIRPRSFALAADAAGGYDLERWRWIRCPVRSVRGADDVFVGAFDDEAFAVRIADFTETVLADTGHFANVERPAQALGSLAIGEAHPAASSTR